MTSTVTPEIGASLKSFKKGVFYDRSQLDMIHALVSDGMRALETEKIAKEDKNEKRA